MQVLVLEIVSYEAVEDYDGTDCKGDFYFEW